LVFFSLDPLFDYYVKDPLWTKEETDILCRLCGRYDIRWPIVFDRFAASTSPPTTKDVTDLQQRYYWVQAKLEIVRRPVMGDATAMVVNGDGTQEDLSTPMGFNVR